MEAAKAPAKFAVFQLHKSIGITILLLKATMRGSATIDRPVYKIG